MLRGLKYCEKFHLSDKIKGVISVNVGKRGNCNFFPEFVW